MAACCRTHTIRASSGCAGLTNMWRRLFKPEVLFLVGVIQALLPFALWWLYGPYPDYPYEISYIPAVIWISGYVAFWVGAKFARPRSDAPQHLAPNTQRLVWPVVALIAAAWIQIAAFNRVYGGIPFIQYLTGRANTYEMEELTMSNAVSGQLGIFLFSQLLLDGFIVTLIVAAKRVKRRPILLASCILTALAAALATGKRQTVAILIIMIMCSSAVYFGNPFRPLLHYFGFRRSKWLARVLVVVLPLTFIAFLGFMVRLRSGFRVSGTQHVLATLHIGLINLETQVAEIGYGPKHWDPLRLGQYLIPDRLLRRISRFQEDPPVHIEPTASAGFYGDLHWNVGLPGVILFSLFAGWFSKYCYLRARSSLFHILAYSLISWTLIAAHSYNHFLHINFLILPCAAYWVVARLVSGRRLRTASAARRTTVASPRYEVVRLRSGSSRIPYGRQ